MMQRCDKNYAIAKNDSLHLYAMCDDKHLPSHFYLFAILLSDFLSCIGFHLLFRFLNPCRNIDQFISVESLTKIYNITIDIQMRKIIQDHLKESDMIYTRFCFLHMNAPSNLQNFVRFIIYRQCPLQFEKHEMESRAALLFFVCLSTKGSNKIQL